MRKLTYAEVKQHIDSREYELLSSEYVNAHHPLELKCQSCGYQWKSNWSRIKQGKGCPQCAGNAPGSCKQLRAILEVDGYKLLCKYVNDKTKVKVQCSEGHEYMVYPGSVKKGHRCQICGFTDNPNRKRYTIDDIRKMAQKHQLTCIDDIYVNCKSDMRFMCQECKREFRTTLDQLIHSNNWQCPNCSSLLHESICRSYFEYIFRKPFAKCRPDWLTNDNGNRLELDGYNPDMRIAFEYNGRQHYQKNAFYNKKKGDFLKLRRDDKTKQIKCREKDVILIMIPFTVKMDRIGGYIIRRLKHSGFTVPKNIPELWKSSTSKHSRQKLEELKHLANERDWALISDRYINCRQKLHFICEHGHDVIINSNNFLNGKGCAVCALEKRRAKNRHSLSYYKEIAFRRGGQCLTGEEDYVNCKTPMNWECKFGHHWMAPGDYITQGSWCPECSRLERIKIR